MAVGPSAHRRRHWRRRRLRRCCLLLELSPGSESCYWEARASYEAGAAAAQNAGPARPAIAGGRLGRKPSHHILEEQHGAPSEHAELLRSNEGGGCVPRPEPILASSAREAP